jgi:hypothetical protein
MPYQMDAIFVQILVIKNNLFLLNRMNLLHIRIMLVTKVIEVIVSSNGAALEKSTSYN